jgi:hypothetical protein
VRSSDFFALMEVSTLASAFSSFLSLSSKSTRVDEKEQEDDDQAEHQTDR